VSDKPDCLLNQSNTPASPYDGTTTGRSGRLMFGVPRSDRRDRSPEAGTAHPHGPRSVQLWPSFRSKGPHPPRTGPRCCCSGSLVRSCYGSTRERSLDCCSKKTHQRCGFAANRVPHVRAKGKREKSKVYSPTHRTPKPLLRNPGTFLKRLDTRSYLGLTTQEPPRSARIVPPGGPEGS
jgi:hypothetical protein